MSIIRNHGFLFLETVPRCRMLSLFYTLIFCLEKRLALFLQSLVLTDASININLSQLDTKLEFLFYEG